jgi:hypothetical protein
MLWDGNGNDDFGCMAMYRLGDPFCCSFILVLCTDDGWLASRLDWQSTGLNCFAPFKPITIQLVITGLLPEHITNLVALGMAAGWLGAVMLLCQSQAWSHLRVPTGGRWADSIEQLFASLSHLPGCSLQGLASVL